MNILSIINFFVPTKWKMVHLVAQPIRIDGRSGNLYFRLFESNKGKRKVKFGCSLPHECDIEYLAEHSTFYNEKFLPWKEGKDYSDIPGFKDC